MESRSRDIRDEGCRRVARTPRSPLGPHRRTQNPYTQIGKTLVDILREDAAAIVDDEAVRMIARQGLPQLLQRPFRRGMGSDVVVENLAGSDLHCNEDVEGPECG